ncbi:lactonase, 7-bladed beta-propeller domain protein [Leptospira perolatii]|uniref:Lactonase, 7-bladed beta-propeller domain protein n=1 Tax=Leptospira perolatii TaxID=2023191 RepID=A0A2M9ZL92_9LEPT|nr:YncE family protein [Leptospira perolatii]PJZ69879.1 lactonase, 7-bladed beta-propeller domain protein [Leptospira perolatii]PJZ72713.1 lactonase, 7-bladed beta-propeller domain protein [Leptospira perolatii]
MVQTQTSLRIYPIHLLSLAFLLTAASCSTSQTATVRNRSSNSEPTTVRFSIQPYKGSTLKIGKDVIPYKILETDKTIAKIETSLPLYSAEDPLEIKIDSPGFAESIILAASADQLNERFFALNKEGAYHEFVNRFKTGIQPKSVRFIDATRIAIPLLEDEGMDVLDVTTGKTVRIAPPELYKKKLGFVETIAIPEYNELWVSQMQANAVHVFDLKSLEYKATVNLSGKWSKILLYDKQRDLVYCSNWISEDISIIDRKSKTEISKTDKIGLPRGLLLSADGKELYIAQFSASNQENGGGRIGIYSLEKGKLMDTIGPPGNKRHIVGAPDGSKIYVSDMCCGKVEVYDTKEKKLTKSIPVFDKPNTIALSPDGKYLYVSCRGPNNPTEGYLKKGHVLGQIFVIDTKTDQVVEFWEAGNQPTGLDVSPDNRYLVTSDFLDHQIRVYRRKGL